MKKILLAVLALLVVAVVAAGVYVARLARSLDTPAFKERVLAEARERLGTEVRVDELNVALLSGVTLRGVAVANPAPFEGDLMTADAFVLRYRLLPLLSGRVQVEQLALEKPSVHLAVNERGVYNYEKLMTSGDAPASAAGPSAAGAAAPPLDVVLQDLSVTDASVTMADADGANLMTVDDADLGSAFRVSGGVAEGNGRATIGTVNLGDVLFVRDVSAPLEMTKAALKLAPVEAKVAGGRAGGDVVVYLQGGFRYESTLELSGVSVRTMLEEAQSPARVSGTLSGKARFEGTAGLETMKGEGQGEVADCKVEDSRVLALLSRVLQVPELANPEFQECRVTFTLRGDRLSTPTLSLKGEALQLTGKGTMNLDSSTLDYDMTLALATALLEKVRVKEFRAAFEPREDGLSTVDFKVFGSTENPQTDLAKRIGKTAATEALKGQVDRLLKGKKIF